MLITDEFLAAREGLVLMRLDGNALIPARALLNDVTPPDDVEPADFRDPFKTPGSYCVVYERPNGDFSVVHRGQREDDIRLDQHNNILLVWIPQELAKLTLARLRLYTTDFATPGQWIAAAKRQTRLPPATTVNSQEGQ